MPFYNIILQAKNILEEYLENSNINYEITLGETDIEREDTLYFSIILENIRYSRLTSLMVSPTYTINILIGCIDTYENFIQKYSDFLEGLILHFHSYYTIDSANIVDLVYDNINNTVLTTISFSIMGKAT